MSQFYTLKRFYIEAKAIVERLEIPNKEIFTLQVQFSYNEKNRGEEFDCFISLSDNKKYNDDTHIDIFVCNPIPAIALNEFELKIKKTFNLPIGPVFNTTDDLAIELPDPNTRTPEA